MFHTKKTLISKKFLITVSFLFYLIISGIQTTQALTFTEVVNLLQAPDINPPLGVTNPKGNIGFILSNLFWGTADGTKNGKIKPQYLDYSGISAWTQSGSNAWYTGTGNIGIGSTVPSDLLTLSGSSGPIIALNGLTTNYRGLKMSDSTGVEKWFAGANNLGNYVIRQNGLTDLMTFSGGNVGIGTTNPNIGENGIGLTTLTVRGSNTNRGTLELATGSMQSNGVVGQITFFNASTLTTSIQNTTDGTNSDSGLLKFFTKATAGTIAERMRIDPTGNVGIGTTNPGAKLHVYADPQTTFPMYIGTADDNDGATKNPYAWQYAPGLFISNDWDGSAALVNSTKVAKIVLNTAAGGYNNGGSIHVEGAGGYNNGQLIFSTGWDSSNLATERMRLNWLGVTIKSLAATYTNSSAFVCVNNSGQLYASESACP